MPTISSQTRFKNESSLYALFEDYSALKYDPACSNIDNRVLSKSIFKTKQADVVKKQQFRRWQYRNRAADVAGRDRARFFDVRYSRSHVTEHELAILQHSYWGSMGAVDSSPTQPAPPSSHDHVFSVSRGTQTQYRDSQTQTDPYSPPYTLQHGAWTEVLTLSSLTWGHGLPPQHAQVAMVKRLRRQRAWSSAQTASVAAVHLNTSSTPASARLRWRIELVNSVEREEWLAREQQITEIQALRLQLMRRLQCEQETKRQQRVTARLQCFWQQGCQIRDHKIAKIKSQFARESRRLHREHASRKRMHPSLRPDLMSRDQHKQSAVVVGRCSGGQARATSTSTHLSRARQYAPLPTSLAGIEQLERVCEQQMSSAERCRLPDPPPTYLLRQHFYRKYHVLRELNQLYDTLQNEKRHTPVVSVKPVSCPAVQLRPPSPPACQLPAPASCDEAVSVVQRVARGSAVQCRLAVALRHRRELIDELRSTQALHSARLLDETLRQQQLQRSITASQRQARLARLQDGVIDEAMSRIESASIARLLTALSNELLRLQEERRVQAFCMLAERERQMREAAEAGLRQKELRKRREIDEVFKHEMRVQQETVEQFLESVVLHSVDAVSDQQARCQLRQLAVRLSHTTDNNTQVISQHDDDEHEETVMSLVHNFLVPHVHNLQQTGGATVGSAREQSRAHLAAARHVVTSLLGATGIAQVDDIVTSREQMSREVNVLLQQTSPVNNNNNKANTDHSATDNPHFTE